MHNVQSSYNIIAFALKHIAAKRQCLQILVLGTQMEDFTYTVNNIK